MEKIDFTPTNHAMPHSKEEFMWYCLLAGAAGHADLLAKEVNVDQVLKVELTINGREASFSGMLEWLEGNFDFAVEQAVQSRTPDVVEKAERILLEATEAFRFKLLNTELK